MKSKYEEKKVSIADKLLNKSIEAFILGIEIYNKPTIKYRIEGFSFFICNAWELMLKAYLINTKGEKSIYYKNNPERTISLENCIKLVFTNNKDPLRINLEKIIELRNTSTHFITEEYEMVYIPLFQACIINFSDKMFEFHNIDIKEFIPYNFLTLQVSIDAIENSSIIAKYPKEIANKLIALNDEITQLSSIQNQRFAIKIVHHHYLVKDKSKATSFVKIDNNAKDNVKILTKLKDPNQTHPYNVKRCVEVIKRDLQRRNIDINFNKYVFLLFVDYFDLKSKEEYCYAYTTGGTTLYSYSHQTINLIINEIQKDPQNIVQRLKYNLKKR